VNLAQALIGNVGTYDFDAKGEIKWQIHKGESTDARYRGGTACSSDEVLVMRVERRGCVIQF